jgi:hypothetical protein
MAQETRSDVGSQFHPAMKIIVARRKLGKERSYGLAWQHLKKIELDSRLTPRKELEIMVHEVSHLVFPKMVEEHVERLGKIVSKVLWQEGYRKNS